jgi:hypothetical protein
LAIFLACFVTAAMMYSPGNPKLTLTSNSLIIHDRFYPVTVHAADVDVAAIKVVNIQTDPAWKPARTNGIGNARYHAGWFRVASGTARMYWTDAAELVLLPPTSSGTPVLFQTDNPEQFAKTLRQQWGSK